MYMGMQCIKQEKISSSSSSSYGHHLQLPVASRAAHQQAVSAKSCSATQRGTCSSSRTAAAAAVAATCAPTAAAAERAVAEQAAGAADSAATVSIACRSAWTAHMQCYVGRFCASVLPLVVHVCEPAAAAAARAPNCGPAGVHSALCAECAALHGTGKLISSAWNIFVLLNSLCTSSMLNARLSLYPVQRLSGCKDCLGGKDCLVVDMVGMCSATLSVDVCLLCS